MTFSDDSESSLSRFEAEAKKQNIMFHMKPTDQLEQMVYIWTG
jgi:hypothetical protein